MNLDKLVDLELERHDWPRLRQADGPATDVPVAFRLLLAAGTPKEAEAAYWMFENHVVVRGTPTEAAVHCVPVICAALVDAGRSDAVRGWLLELLFQIVGDNGGLPTADDVSEWAEWKRQSRAEAAKGLWLLYRELAVGRHAAAYDVLCSLVDGHPRTAFVVDRLRLRTGNAKI